LFSFIGVDLVELSRKDVGWVKVQAVMGIEIVVLQDPRDKGCHLVGLHQLRHQPLQGVDVAVVVPAEWELVQLGSLVKIAVVV